MSHYRIDLPLREYVARPIVEAVNVTSNKQLRLHVQRFATYFLREMHFGGLQFEAAETENSPGFRPYFAYLISTQDRFIGAACFRNRIEHSSTYPWLFDWVWLHPYFRRCGYLGKVWPSMTERHGRFRVSQPVSEPMKAFLAKVGYEAP